MKASELDYRLPPELIAQQPAKRRDESRLLVYDRASGETRHRRFVGASPGLVEDTPVAVDQTPGLSARAPVPNPRGGGFLLERGGEGGHQGGVACPTQRLPASR